MARAKRLAHDERRICPSCTGNTHLKTWLADQGTEGACSFCGGSEPTGRFDLFAAHVCLNVAKCLSPVSNPQEFDHHVSCETAVQQLASVEPVVAAAIAAAGPWPEDWHGWFDDLFWSEKWHVEPGLAWGKVRRVLLEEARYFGQAKDELDQLLGSIRSFRGGQAISQLTSQTTIYRARQAWTPDDRAQILEAPERELGAPPKESARAGRMNSSGIPVLYGAFEEMVAVSELRPSAGDVLVVGQFRPSRLLSILDLSALSDWPQSEVFGSGYEETAAKQQFLRDLDGELSEPVLLHQESISYVPTQVISEYLHLAVGLDGIAYSSAQVPRTSQAGRRNVALFGRAGHVAGKGAPGLDCGLEFVAGSARVVRVSGVEVSYEPHTDFDWRNYQALGGDE